MSTPIANPDLRRFLAGVGVAAAAGLLLGGAMQPNLRGDERPEGPQILGPVSGERSYEPTYGGATYTSYGDQVPEYVIGTDWLTPPRYEDAYDEGWFDIPPEDETVVFDESFDEPPPVQAAAAWDEPREPPVYPSMAGGAAYGADLPAPPPPPVQSASETTLIVVGG